MKFNQTFLNCVRNDLDSGAIVFLVGEPGIGKSSWTQALAEMLRTECFTVRCNQLADKADVTGARLVPYTRADGSQGYKQCFYPHATIMRCVDYAEAHPNETPILFLDELNRTNADVTSELLSIPTDRYVGDVHLPENVIVMCAGNDKGNVTSLDEASISRFVVYHMEPDTATFLSLDPELNPFIKTVLERHPEVIFCKQLPPEKSDEEDVDMSIDEIIGADDGMAQITTPRTISKLSGWLNRHTNDELLALLADTSSIGEGENVSMLQELVEAHVGRTMFSVYLLAEMAGGLSQTSNQSNNMTVLKPAMFDTLKSLPDRMTLANEIAGLNQHDKSGCLLYAIFDKGDNRAIIRELATAMTGLESADIKQLMLLASFGKLDDDNVQALLECDSPLTQSLSIIIENVH